MWLSHGCCGQGGGIPKHGCSFFAPLLLGTLGSPGADQAGNQGHWDLLLNLGLHVLLTGDIFSTSPAASLRMHLEPLPGSPMTTLMLPKSTHGSINSVFHLYRWSLLLSLHLFHLPQCLMCWEGRRYLPLWGPIRILLSPRPPPSPPLSPPPVST